MFESASTLEICQNGCGKMAEESLRWKKVKKHKKQAVLETHQSEDVNHSEDEWVTPDGGNASMKGKEFHK